MLRVIHRNFKLWFQVGVVTLLIFAAVPSCRRSLANAAPQSGGTPATAHEVGSEMDRYTKQGQYEEAIQVGLSALEHQPSDEIIYESIATVYLVRARKDSEHGQTWVQEAVSYTEKALSLNSKTRDVAGAHLLQGARSFESAGDVSVEKRCNYYDRARKLLEDRTPLLQGDELTLAGKTFPLEPLRKENDRVLAGVKDKATKAGCK